MKIIKVLHSFWVGNRTEYPKTQRSWLKLDKAIQETVPKEKQKTLTRIIEDHSNSVEYSGFVAGFKMATKLWREL